MNKNAKKLNVFTLSGLIIGPILGSGVILLPPLLYNIIANYSLIIWICILLFGFSFALIFGKLAILFPGHGGVSLATKAAMGKKYQQLTSFYLICAVFFGPVAVLLIAANFVQIYFPDISPVILGLYIYLITYVLLLIKIDFLGNLMLIVTSAITLLFLVCSINILLHVEIWSFELPSISLGKIGYALLLVFWAVVGWEVIGNYSNDVKDIKTLSNAVVFSAITVSLIYLLVALAICFGDFENKSTEVFKLIWIIEPIFHDHAQVILASMSIVLCVGTLILFVGGVARLISSLKITTYSSKHLSNGTPIGALNFLSLIYFIILYLVSTKVLSLDDLVAFADGFFIANAIIGLITAIILFKNGVLRYSAILLTIIFFIILLFSNIYILVSIFFLFILTYLRR